LSPIARDAVFRVLGEVATAGTAILLVEQNASAALSLATRGYVMETGRVTLEGSAEMLKTDDRVKAAYLGAPE
jgi:branched-chain amino acid transport system ATP-binding protein